MSVTPEQMAESLESVARKLRSEEMDIDAGIVELQGQLDNWTDQELGSEGSEGSEDEDDEDWEEDEDEEEDDDDDDDEE